MTMKKGRWSIFMNYIRDKENLKTIVFFSNVDYGFNFNSIYQPWKLKKLKIIKLVMKIN